MTRFENAVEVKHTIRNLYVFLKKAEADEYIVRTTYCNGGWIDNETEAHCAGFDITRFINADYEERHEFSECYHLTRRK